MHVNEVVSPNKMNNFFSNLGRSLTAWLKFNGNILKVFAPLALGFLILMLPISLLSVLGLGLTLAALTEIVVSAACLCIGLLAIVTLTLVIANLKEGVKLLFQSSHDHTSQQAYEAGHTRMSSDLESISVIEANAEVNTKHLQDQEMDNYSFFQAPKLSQTLEERFQLAIEQLPASVKAQFEDEALNEGYQCAFTFELMSKPCRTPNGGQQWIQREELKKHLADNHTDPFATRMPMSRTEVHTDREQQQRIIEFVERAEDAVSFQAFAQSAMMSG